MADLDATFARREDLIVERVLDQTVVLDPASDSFARLNRTGRRVWDLLAEPRTVSELGAALAAESDVDEGRARSDVEAFVRELLERRLVEPVTDAARGT